MMEQATMQSKDFLMANKAWLTQIVVTLLISLVIFMIVFIVLHLFQLHHTRTVSRKKERSEEVRPLLGIWWWSFFEALSSPLYVTIWIVGVIYSLSLIKIQGQYFIDLNILGSIRSIVLVCLLFWFLMRFVSCASARALSFTGKRKPDLTSVHALTKIGRLSSFIVVMLVFLQEFGVPLSGVIAFGGGSALVVGIAARDLLANFFGGWVVIMDKPFKVGDWISSPDKEIEGTVEYIGWRSTRIRTFDKRPLYVPNALFTTIAIENPSRMLNRRIKKVIGVRYDDANKIENISIAIKKMLTSHPDIDQKQVIFVSLIDFAPSSLNILIYAFTKTTEWVPFQEIQENVMLKILEAVESCGGQSAFPTSTIEIPKGLILSKQEELHVRES